MTSRRMDAAPAAPPDVERQPSGPVLIQILIDRGWKKSAAGKRIGVHPAQIGRILKGEQQASTETHRRLLALVESGELPAGALPHNERGAPLPDPVQRQPPDISVTHGKDEPVQRQPLVDIKQVAADAVSHLEAICAHWLPDGKRQGHDWVARNPTRDDQNAGSFSVSLITGGCIDHATGEQCHDIVSTIKYLEGLPTQGEAARLVADFLGTAPRPEPTVATRARPAPKPMATRPTAHPRLGLPSRCWEYPDQDRNILCVVMRFETADGKQFRPLTPTPDGWIWKAPAEPRPLYGLDRLAARPDAAVILCEGEKAADAAGMLLPEGATIASMNGAQSPKKTDWTPLKGRVVRIWPDADEPGEQFAHTAAALVQAAGAASVSILDLSSLTGELPPGWDAADALADGWTPDRFAETAKWEPTDSPCAEATREPEPEPEPVTDIRNEDAPKPTAKTPDGWKLTRKMVFEIKETEGERKLIPICGHLRVTGRTTGAHGEWGLVLAFRNHDGRELIKAMPAARLHEDPSVLVKELALEGLKTLPGKEKKVLAYLADWEPDTRILSAKRLGWIEDKTGALAFVLPDRVITRDGSGQVVFQPDRFSPTTRTVHAAGDLADWQSQVAGPACQHPLMRFALCAGLAPPLLSFAEAGDSFILHYWGTTSRGKTTVGQLAASPWGCAADPNDAPSLTFIRRWNITGNGLEGLAEAHSDMPLVLDELGSSTVGDIRPLIYQLAGGQGKTALNSAREMKEPRSWRTIAISTGEISIHARMADPTGDGTQSKTIKGGLTHRALDVEIDDIASGVPADQRGVTVTGIKVACARHYGTAGPELIRLLAARFQTHAEARAYVRERVAYILPQIAPAGLPAETERAVRRFALIAVAGEFASLTGLIPTTAKAVIDATKGVVDRWLNLSAETDDQRLIASVRAFILKHESRFQRINEPEPIAVGHYPRQPNDEPVRDRVGYVDRKAGKWMFTDAGLVEAAPGHDRTTIARTLRKHGHLFMNSDKMTTPITISGSRPRLYVVKASIIEDCEDEKTGNLSKTGVSGVSGVRDQQRQGFEATHLADGQGVRGVRQGVPAIDTPGTAHPEHLHTGQSVRPESPVITGPAHPSHPAHPKNIGDRLFSEKGRDDVEVF